MDKRVVYFGEKSIPYSGKITFFELKRLILIAKNRLVLYFKSNDTIIIESFLVRNYPNFSYEMDPNSFKEFTKGKFRCIICRKYVKLEKLLYLNNLESIIIFNRFYYSLFVL